MISLSNLSKGLGFTAVHTSLTMLSGCITSNDVLFNAVTTPMRAGKYEVQYLVDGKWTKFGAGSLGLVNGKYTWAEGKGAASFLNWNPDGLGFALIDIGNNYFIIVVATADLTNPIWAGHYMYGVARHAGVRSFTIFLVAWTCSCRKGLSDPQIEKIETHECLYSSKASLTSALTANAKRTALWKRLAPSSH
jgi:hypothetical protein